MPGTDFFFLNTTTKPFNDVRVRRALNYAIDRNEIVKIYGGSDAAEPTCQILPPQMPGFRRYCPYTRLPGPDGRWRGPDLERARELVTASGTAGAEVKVWDTPQPQIALDQGRYLTGLLRQLGYRATLHILNDRRFLEYTGDPRNHAQVVSGGWSVDYPSPSNFFGNLTCGSYTDSSEYCNPAVAKQIKRAASLQATRPDEATALWARLDRQITDQAVWLPTVTPRATTILSKRVGNYQNNPFWGTLIDQLWVR